MWRAIASFIIRQRIILTLLTVGVTAWLGWEARLLEMSYEYLPVVPKEDPDMIFFQQFKKQYGEDGNIMVVGLKDENLYKLKNFAKFQNYCYKLKTIEGVNDVISIPTLRKLTKDTAQGVFSLSYVFWGPVQYQSELDSLLKVSFSTVFYEGLVFNSESKATLVAITLNKDYLNSPRRKQLIGTILEQSNDFSTSSSIDLHYAGLPYVRYIMISTFKEEFNFLLIMSGIVTCAILFFFFRSFNSVLFTVLVIIITAVWTGGLITVLGYKITLLTGMLPALLVVISIPTCIYMFNKYHQEYRKHRNKVKAVTLIIQKIGFITFMTNANTAVGFLVLYFTDISIIKEFGLVAGVMSFATFLITIVVIPAVLLYMPDPSEKQMLHLDKKMLGRINTWVAHVVSNHSRLVYIITVLCIAISVYGMFQLKPIGFMVDDMPERSGVKSDMAFFEKEFKGVMPLEILVDLGKRKAAYKLSNLQKLEEFEDSLMIEPGISRPISLISVVKSATQSFYNDTEDNYRLPTNNEKNFILRYFGKKNSELDILRTMVDSSAQVVRLSMKVADMGTAKMDDLFNVRIKRKIDSVFKGTDIKAQITGTSLLFLKGNLFLLRDLTESMFYAFALISLMMAFLFFDIRMILISIIPNLIPMIITAGLMGLLDIRLKISTAIIFSISFGITIDSTIHYLSKFKQEIQTHPDITILEAVIKSIKEAGVSMIYTAVVLIFGFGIFLFSDFGGTIALGLLTCITLFFALLTNMILLPVLLVTFVGKNVRNIKGIDVDDD
ncbi:MAG: MMPL family transporter [Bacteroidota bacterium]|nr:MMPL family transporter [Bacteroidota bacterium]